ncbi:MAG TPA: alpha/beta fold hydrolase [Woeseiaceae bacterium]|jgi:pimeloyl-ACP methyl ester carboxylesterase|nr:alpha/beta fold hydrolase [Woeseiaceae bacterium]
MNKTLVFLPLFLSTALHAQETAEPVEHAETDLFARDTYRIESLICPFKGSIEYEPGEIECGLLQVPENREKPDSRYIDLHFVKLNSTWDDEEERDEDEYDASIEPGKRDDPVIYLTGGPGAVVEGYVDRFKDHRIRHHRDLYILEQRGIANSGDYCETYYTRKPELGDVGTLEEAAVANRQRSADCARNAMAAGVDYTAYNTIENARDVKALRIALGFEQWNVWGISYGTLLGQAYVKEDPEGILAVALDAIVPLDARADPISWRIVNWYDRDLKKLDELCQANDTCAGDFPNLGERVRDAARAVTGNAIEVEVSETEVFPSGKAYFMSDIAAFLPFTLFYEQDNYAALPAIIDAWADTIESRDETTFKALALGLAASGGVFGGSQGMYDAIMCNDGYREAAIASFAADRAEFPILTNAIALEGDAEAWAQNCIDIGAAPRPRADYTPVQTDLPTLLIEGDMDPITPPPLAHEIEPGFTNGTYVEFPYAGHGPSRSVECGGDLLNKFYDDPTAEPDLSCVDEMEVPDFIGSLHRMSFGPKFTVLALEDKEKLPGVAAWGGLSVLIVLNGFFVLTFAPLVRRMEKRKPAPAGRARVATWAAAMFGMLALCIIGAAAGVSYELSDVLMLFGMVGWAAWGSWFGVLAGLVGVLALFLTVQARRELALPTGTLVGFALVNLAALSLSVFLVTWGFGP